MRDSNALFCFLIVGSAQGVDENQVKGRIEWSACRGTGHQRRSKHTSLLAASKKLCNQIQSLLDVLSLFFLSFACKLRDELPATILFLPEADPVCQPFDRDGDFNYDIKFKEATRESPLLTEKAEKLKKDGYAINHARVRLGSGREVFVEGKKLLQSWGYSFASILQ